MELSLAASLSGERKRLAASARERSLRDATRGGGAVALASGQPRAKARQQIVRGYGGDIVVAQDASKGRSVAICSDVREWLEPEAALDPDSPRAQSRMADRVEQRLAERIRGGLEGIEPAVLQRDDLVRPTRLREIVLVPRRDYDDGVVWSQQRDRSADDRPVSREQQHVARQRTDQSIEIR